MKNKHLLLLLCAMSSQIMQAAATEDQQIIPEHIRLTFKSQIQGGTYKIRIPTSTRESISGKTLEELSQESIAKGLPLALIQILYSHFSHDGPAFSTKLIDPFALVRAYDTWDNTILTGNTAVIDCKDMIKIMDAALNKHVHAKRASYTHRVSSVASIGPRYRGTVSVTRDTWTHSTDTSTLTLNNPSFTSLALLYEFTKDRRMLLALHELYGNYIEQSGGAKFTPDIYEAMQKIFNTINPEIAHTMVTLTLSKTTSPTPKCIQIDLENFISGMAYTLKVPFTDTEPISGETYKQRSQATVKKGLPLLLTHIIYTNKRAFSSETVDLAALIRAYATWDSNILTDDTTVIDCDDIESMVRAAVQHRLDERHQTLQGFCSYITAELGPMHKELNCGVHQDLLLHIKNKKTLLLKNATFTAVALLNEFTNDPRMLMALHVMYTTYAEASVGELKADFNEAERRILQTMKPREHEWL